MKLVVCGSCEAEFRIKHSMDEGYYAVSFCPFCGEELDDELGPEIKKQILKKASQYKKDSKAKKSTN